MTEQQTNEILEPTMNALESDAGSIELSEMEHESNKIADAEWCFQFFNNEPIVFAWQDATAEPSPLVLKVNPVVSDGLNFQHNGMTFRIFPREISEESKLERQKQDESKNKEN